MVKALARFAAFLTSVLVILLAAWGCLAVARQIATFFM